MDEEDTQPLGADQLFDASFCAQLLTHTTTVDKTQRPPSRWSSCSIPNINPFLVLVQLHGTIIAGRIHGLHDGSCRGMEHQLGCESAPTLCTNPMHQTASGHPKVDGLCLLKYEGRKAN